MIQWGIVLTFALSEFVRTGKLSKAEVFGLFSSEASRGYVYEFQAKNRLKNRMTQGNLDSLHIAHKNHAFVVDLVS